MRLRLLQRITAVVGPCHRSAGGSPLFEASVARAAGALPKRGACFRCEARPISASHCRHAWVSDLLAHAARFARVGASMRGPLALRARIPRQLSRHRLCSANPMSRTSEPNAPHSYRAHRAGVRTWARCWEAGRISELSSSVDDTAVSRGTRLRRIPGNVTRQTHVFIPGEAEARVLLRWSSQSEGNQSSIRVECPFGGSGTIAVVWCPTRARSFLRLARLESSDV